MSSTALSARLVVAAFAVTALLLGMGAAACGTSGRSCAPGDYRYCACSSSELPAARGYEQCLDDGSRYGACDCSGAVPNGAGVLVDPRAPAEDAGVEEGGAVGFLEPCETDEGCATKLCFDYNAYGPHCSQPCNKDLECPPPSPGCNQKGVCKLH